MIRTSALVLLLLCPAASRPQEKKPYGLEKRLPWTTSRVVGSPEPPLPYAAHRAFPKLSFKNSLYMACEPGTDRVLVVEQAGRVLAFRNDPATDKSDVFCEIKDADTYSICFAPDYVKSRRVYVFSNGPNSAKRRKNRILRFDVSPSTSACDPASESLILEWESNGHNGGEMAFGSDGFFYISSGDGTSDSDTDLTGQDPSDLLSGILRIDLAHPDPGRAYSVPADNPFLRLAGVRPELWAYGFRNPWRMTFDPATGDLWVGDIGQDLWEMVHVVQKGANYGWSVFEGGRPFQLRRKRGPTPVSPPTIAHHHSEMRSVTGGVVYTGPKFKDLQGAYVYADYSTGRVWGARYREGKVTWHRELADTPYEILGLAQDGAGEIYLVDYKGALYRLEPSPAAEPVDFPRKLSETGLFSSVAGHAPADGLIPYSVNSPLWSDGAFKERFLALPGDSRIEFTEQNAWKLPEGTVLVKTFSFGGRRHETRLLTLQQGEWLGYTYAWNAEQTEATLVEKEGRDVVLAPGHAWRFPSRAECMVCHSRASGFVLGLNTLQMNRDHDYGRVRDNQLRALEHAEVFKVDLMEHVRAREGPAERLAEALSRSGRLRPLPVVPAWTAIFHFAWAAARPRLVATIAKGPRTTAFLPKRPGEYRRLPDPADATADLELRARSYLHANCAQCHVGAGGGNSAFDIHWNTPREKTKLIDVEPAHDTFGIKEARLVAPGDPNRSVLLWRLGHRGTGQMPPLATSLIDDEATTLISDWIRSLKP